VVDRTTIDHWLETARDIVADERLPDRLRGAAGEALHLYSDPAASDPGVRVEHALEQVRTRGLADDNRPWPPPVAVYVPRPGRYLITARGRICFMRTGDALAPDE
jgi:hypothetical protein